MTTVLNPIKCSSEIMCVTFHPSKDVLVSGDIDGKVRIYSTCCQNKEAKELMDFNHHKKSCRRVSFNREGEARLFSASSDKSFCSIDLEQGSVVRRITKAHEVALYSMYAINQHMVATGDDDGGLKLWDMRLDGAVMSMKESDDCITDIVGSTDRKVLLATSGEGTLSAFDPRKHKLKLQSELMDAALQSVAIVKNGEKVVCGGEDGVLSFFNWGEYGNISDRFPGHPFSIEKIVPLNPHLILTAASDAIRAVSVFPNRIVDIVGDHGGAPIEDLSLNHHKSCLASISHDQHIRFWDVSKIDSSKKLSKKGVPKNKFITKCNLNKRDDFFSGLVQDIEDQEGKDKSQDDDEEEEEEEEEDVDNEKPTTSTKKMESIDDKLSDEDSNEEDEEGGENSEAESTSDSQSDASGNNNEEKCASDDDGKVEDEEEEEGEEDDDDDGDNEAEPSTKKQKLSDK